VKVRLGLAAAILITLGCRSQPAPASGSQGIQALAWRRMGSWSGHGNLQTESVTTDSGQLRIKWHTAASGPNGAKGTFRLSAQSSISGRPMEVPVDTKGPGEGTAFVDQDPHVLYFVVESAELDWSFTVEDSVAGTVEKAPQSRTP